MTLKEKTSVFYTTQILLSQRMVPSSYAVGVFTDCGVERGRGVEWPHRHHMQGGVLGLE